MQLSSARLDSSPCSNLVQRVLVGAVRPACFASENVPCRKAMTMAAHRWKWFALGRECPDQDWSELAFRRVDLAFTAPNCPPVMFPRTASEFGCKTSLPAITGSPGKVQPFPPQRQHLSDIQAGSH